MLSKINYKHRYLLFLPLKFVFDIKLKRNCSVFTIIAQTVVTIECLFIYNSAFDLHVTDMDSNDGSSMENPISSMQGKKSAGRIFKSIALHHIIVKTLLHANLETRF